MPCPASLNWLVDNSIRHQHIRPVLDDMGLRPGETVLELGPGPGAFTVEAARLEADLTPAHPCPPRPLIPHL